MKKYPSVLFVVFVAVAVLPLLVSRLQGAPSTPSAKASPATVKRGAFLVKVSVCNDCHTPWKMGPNGPEPDMTKMLSGHPEGLVMPHPPQPAGPWIWSGAASNTAFAGPWGISYAINLTPDPNTGLGGGAWTEDVFVKAIKTGKHFGTSRPILPPMPWDGFSNYSEADLKAIYAYLMTIPPIVNHVPDAVEAPPPSAPKK